MLIALPVLSTPLLYATGVALNSPFAMNSPPVMLNLPDLIDRASSPTNFPPVIFHIPYPAPYIAGPFVASIFAVGLRLTTGTVPVVALTFPWIVTPIWPPLIVPAISIVTPFAAVVSSNRAIPYPWSAINVALVPISTVVTVPSSASVPVTFTIRPSYPADAPLNVFWNVPFSKLSFPPAKQKNISVLPFVIIFPLPLTVNFAPPKTPNTDLSRVNVLPSKSSIFVPVTAIDKPDVVSVMSFFTCIISSVPTNASFNSSMVVTSVAAFTVVASAITMNNTSAAKIIFFFI